MGYLSEEVPIHHPLHHPSRPVSQPSDQECIVAHHLTNHQVSIKYRYLYEQPIGMLVIHAVCNESTQSRLSLWIKLPHRGLCCSREILQDSFPVTVIGECRCIHIVLIPVCCESNFNLKLIHLLKNQFIDVSIQSELQCRECQTYTIKHMKDLYV